MRIPTQAEAARADADAALRELEHGWGSWWSRHWADLCVVAGGALLLGRLAYVGMHALAPASHELRASVDLPAFTVLQPRHLTPDSAAKRLAGRYLLRPVRAGAPLSEESVGPASLSPALLAGRYTLALRLAPGAVPEPVRTGTRAAVLVSPSAANATGFVLERVPVLAASPSPDGGTDVVLALARAELDSLTPRLGSARVFLLAGGAAP